jgi:hypothetical protein
MGRRTRSSSSTSSRSAPYTSRNASEFFDGGEPTPEEKEILGKVDANSKAAFRVEN